MELIDRFIEGLNDKKARLLRHTDLVVELSEIGIPTILYDGALSVSVKRDMLGQAIKAALKHGLKRRHNGASLEVGIVSYYVYYGDDKDYSFLRIGTEIIEDDFDTKGCDWDEQPSRLRYYLNCKR